MKIDNNNLSFGKIFEITLYAVISLSIISFIMYIIYNVLISLL